MTWPTRARAQAVEAERLRDESTNKDHRVELYCIAWTYRKMADEWEEGEK